MRWPIQLVYRLRVVYKSGHVEDFDCTEFTITGGRYEWTAASPNRPILLGVDEVSAVWQRGTALRLRSPFA